MRRVVFAKAKNLIFQAKFDTTKTSVGSTAINQLKIPLNDSSTHLPFIIQWGDGTENYISNVTDAGLIHTYTTAGIYTVTIIGRLFSIFFNNSGDRLKIIEIEKWGPFLIRSACLKGCANLILDYTSDKPLLSAYEISSAFEGCTSLVTVNKFNEWDLNKTGVSGQLKNIDGFFKGCIKLNMPLNLFLPNTGTATDFLSGCTAFNSNVLIIFDKVTSLANFFLNCSNFNSALSISGTHNVTNTTSMFQGCTKFNQPINGFTTNSLITATLMFAEAIAFNQDITGWNMRNASEINAMFRNALAFNQDIGIWNFNKNAYFNTSFMQGKIASTLNPQYLANLYIKMAANLIGTGRTQTNKNFGAGSVKYHSSGASARAALVADGWTMTDGGMI